jgi:glycosyltransferase involved in cell wall biosynthesis
MSDTLVSVVIPVHDEAAIVERAVRRLHRELARLGRPFEIVLAENGSTDDTAAIIQHLGRELDSVRLVRVPDANYGRALRQGLEAARGDVVVCDEIDLGDVDFYARALPLVDGGADLVIGSKRHPASRDRRPLVRRAGTAAVTLLLRLSLGFRGTDTHGLKVLRRARLLPVARSCAVEHDLFASELVVRAARAGLDVRELPLDMREIRPPSVGLWRRVPRVLRDIARLVYVIRVRG